MLTPNKAIAWLIVICHTPAKKNKKHNPSTLFIALPPSPSIGLRGRSRRGLLQEKKWTDSNTAHCPGQLPLKPRMTSGGLESKKFKDKVSER